ncbi:MAG: leucine-rich repeat domain-containing protein [Clostridia bacterium]|nr:leucine-rich repeat domain-containing protein [Clostridia bacterium]
MAVYRVTDAQLTAVADAIRAKTGGEEPLIFPQGFAQAVAALETGGAASPYVEYTTNESGAITFAKLYGFTALPASFFYGCTALTDVDWSESPNLSSIGDQAFYGCTGLQMTTLPNAVTSIGAKAFESSQVKLTALPTGLTTLGERAFSGCRSLAISALPSGLTVIPNYAFMNCLNITVSTLPEGLTSIGASAFKDCKKLAVSKIPAGVTSVGTLAFSGCTGLVNMEIACAVLGPNTKNFNNCTGLEKVWFRSSCVTVAAASAANSQFVGCSDSLAIYAEPAAKPAGWGDYFNRTGANGSTAATVTWNQSTRPW